MSTARSCLSSALAPVPPHTILKLDARPAETVQSTPYREIDLAPAQPLDRVQVLQVPPSAGICDGDRAPLRQALDELLVYALLQSFIVCGMDEEF